MASKQQGQFTYAGATDSSYEDYSQTLRVARGAIVVPLLDPHAPDTGDDAPFSGTTGLFDVRPATSIPLGPWNPEYGGNLPISVQPKINAPEPWRDPWTGGS